MKKQTLYIFILCLSIIVFIFVSYKNFNIFVKNNNMTDVKKVYATYGKEFISNKGDSIIFEDFSLVDMGKTKPTVTEIEKQRKSMEMGIDGGSSVISDTWHLNLISKNGEYLNEVAVRMLPYGHGSFVINKKVFTLTSGSIVYVGDIESLRMLDR